MAFDRLLADVSAGFINLPAAQVDGAITESLRRICEVLDVDRVSLIRFADGRGAPRVTHSAAVPGYLEGSPGKMAAVFPWAIPRVMAGLTTAFSRWDELPGEAAVDKATWQKYGVKSCLAVPVEVSGAIEGCIALDCQRAERTWSADLIERMQVMATVFGSAIAHKQARDELDAAVRFEQVASNTLANLVGARRAEQDSALVAGLRAVAQALGADRATLWQRVGDRAEFSKTHRGLAEGAAEPPTLERAPKLAWIDAQLAQGAVVRFSRHGELPAEATADREGLKTLGIGAALFVPLFVAGSVAGALSFASAQSNHAWPDVFVPRARLLGEAFAGFLARDAAERREQEAQAQAAHAARVGTMGVFAATLVHELTQPLAASLANAETAAELLEPEVPALADLRATVADIVADSRRAGEMVQRLRRFLRHGEVERVELDLPALLADVLAFVKAEAVDQGIAIALDVAPALPRIVGDRVQIQQVLLNLLLNALDAVAGRSPGERWVAVRAGPCAAGLGIEVTDSGVGMDEAMLGRVFQPFFTTKPGGMGLGLSISQTLAAGHGGMLSVRSAPGQGSTFRVELPLRQALVIAPLPGPAALPDANGTVFVVDDDEAMRRALERQLRGEGYRVEVFATAHAFLDRAVPAGVACIVSDLRMPGMSGLELQTALAQAGSALPIVFISGQADIPTSVQAMKAGAMAFLPKPFVKAELLAAVADAMARSRERADEQCQDADVVARHRSLTPREREVFGLVAAGLLNKTVADRLHIAEATVKIHRRRAMEKMQAHSVASLVRMAERIAARATAGAAPPPHRRPAPKPAMSM